MRRIIRSARVDSGLVGWEAAGRMRSEVRERTNERESVLFMAEVEGFVSLDERWLL